MTNSCLDKALKDGVNCYKLTVNWRENRGDRVQAMSFPPLLDLTSRIVTRSRSQKAWMSDDVATRPRVCSGDVSALCVAVLAH